METKNGLSNAFSQRDFADILKKQKEKTPEQALRAYNEVKERHGPPQHILTLCANAKEINDECGIGISMTVSGDRRVITESIAQAIQHDRKFAEVIAAGVAKAIVADSDFGDYINHLIEVAGNKRHPLQDLFEFIESLG